MNNVLPRTFNNAMKVNITAGECLNRILEARHPGECFVPFNEAMNQGTYSAPLFSEEFVRERAVVHGVSEAEYLEKLSGFMEILKHAGEYDEIVLWFGDEPFCVANSQTVLDALRGHGCRRSILLNIVNEGNGDIIRQETVISNVFPMGTTVTNAFSCGKELKT